MGRLPAPASMLEGNGDQSAALRAKLLQLMRGQEAVQAFRNGLRFGVCTLTLRSVLTLAVVRWLEPGHRAAAKLLTRDEAGGSPRTSPSCQGCCGAAPPWIVRRAPRELHRQRRGSASV